MTEGYKRMPWKRYRIADPSSSLTYYHESLMYFLQIFDSQFDHLIRTFGLPTLPFWTKTLLLIMALVGLVCLLLY